MAADPSTIQAINTVCAGPSSGSTGPTSFRKLVAADVPSGCGFVNVLRNSTFVSWPNGTSGSIYTSGSGSGLIAANGWAVEGASADSTWQQEALGHNGTYYSLRLTGATGNTDETVRQRIGGSDGAKIAGQRCTFQAAIYNSTGASLTPQLSTYYANSFENFSATTTDLSATNLQSIANGAWGIVAYTFDVSSSASNGYGILVDFGAITSNSNYVQITATDLRVTTGVATGLNSSPPVPELPYLAYELERNAVYYRTSYANGTAPGTSFTAGSAAQPEFFSDGSHYLVGYVPFNVPMRASPTLTVYDEAGNSSKVSGYYSSAWHDSIALTSSTPGAQGFAFQSSSTSPLYTQFGYSAYADFW
ncbi:MAG: hypothetical protein KGL39_03640 [Patescibacteria group bacterium]|nr:hypothetical protein [Patescibacteria group bacterium]